jgi:hypothetical protein
MRVRGWPGRFGRFDRPSRETVRSGGKQHNHHTHQEVSVQLAAEHPATTVLGDKAGQRGAVTTTRSPLALKAAVRRVIRKLLAQTS